MKLLHRLQHLPRDTRDTLFLLTVIAWIILPQTGHLPLCCGSGHCHRAGGCCSC